MSAPIVHITQRFDDEALEVFLRFEARTVCRLSLCEAALSSEGVARLAGHLSQMTSLVSFDYETEGDEAQLYPLLAVLPPHTCRVRIAASWGSHGAKLRGAMERLPDAALTVGARGTVSDPAEFVGNLPAGTALTLEGCGIAEDALLAMMGAPGMANVVDLDISGNAVSPRALAALFAGPPRGRARVQGLDLSRTGVGADAFRQAAAGAADFLQRLLLKSVHLDASAMDALMAWAEKLPALRLVQLSMNREDPFWAAGVARLAARVSEFVYVSAGGVPWDLADREFLACHVAAAGGRANIYVEASRLHEELPWSRLLEKPAAYAARLRRDATLYRRAAESELLPPELLLPAAVDASGFPERMLRRAAHILEN